MEQNFIKICIVIHFLLNWLVTDWDFGFDKPVEPAFGNESWFLKTNPDTPDEIVIFPSPWYEAGLL